MLMFMEPPGGALPQRARALVDRLDALEMTEQELARRAGVDRQTVARAREGEARRGTYAKLEKTLDTLEAEIGPDIRDVRAVMELPDGTRVTFRGLSAEDVARAVAVYLQESANEG
jgi:transcriptional regulator with XRE-family HTH domain